MVDKEYIISLLSMSMDTLIFLSFHLHHILSFQSLLLDVHLSWDAWFCIVLAIWMQWIFLLHFCRKKTKNFTTKKHKITIEYHQPLESTKERALWESLEASGWALWEMGFLPSFGLIQKGSSYLLPPGRSNFIMKSPTLAWCTSERLEWWISFTSCFLTFLRSFPIICVCCVIIIRVKMALMETNEGHLVGFWFLLTTDLWWWAKAEETV